MEKYYTYRALEMREDCAIITTSYMMVTGEGHELTQDAVIKEILEQNKGQSLEVLIIFETDKNHDNAEIIYLGELIRPNDGHSIEDKRYFIKGERVEGVKDVK